MDIRLFGLKIDELIFDRISIRIWNFLHLQGERKGLGFKYVHVLERGTFFDNINALTSTFLGILKLRGGLLYPTAVMLPSDFR